MPISPYNADMQTSSQESTTELRFRPFSNNRWVRRAVETFDKEWASMYKTVDAVVYFSMVLIWSVDSSMKLLPKPLLSAASSAVYWPTAATVDANKAQSSWPYIPYFTTKRITNVETT